MFQLLYGKVNNLYERFFQAYGCFLSKHYGMIITIAFIVNILLSSGVYKQKMVTDADELFVPVNSEAKKDEVLVKQLFSQVK